MLVLSRKLGEGIRIGQDIEIVVTAVLGNCVRLGITAPGDISIWRGELIVNGVPPPARRSSQPGEAHQAVRR
jgi:carbon storage regulator